MPGGKWAKKDFLQKYLPIFIFLSDLSRLKIVEAYN